MLNRTLNNTSQVLDALNQELSEVRAGFLENRATIDYLPLQHHLGFKEFPHMCCFNITNNYYKISQLISDIRAQLDKIRVSPGLFDWLGNWGQYFRDAVLLIEIIVGFCLFLYVCRCLCCLMPSNISWEPFRGPLDPSLQIL